MSTAAISTNGSGEPITGTTGTTIGNVSQDQLGSSQFLDLLMDQLKYQNPLSPSDPTTEMQELAEMSSVQQETNIAQSTSQSATSNAVASAVGLIGDSISYTDPATGKSITGTVQSVQITSDGPTLTVNGAAGVEPSTITSVTSAQQTSTASTSTASAS